MSKIFKKLIRPVLFRLDAEKAHEIGVEALRLGLTSRFAQVRAAKRFKSEQFGGLERFGLEFSNPLGIAAGFDKNGIVVNQLATLGFGFVEVGTVTYEPQKGNPKPRLFRLSEDEALINRLGFNNDGAERVAERLRKLDRKCVVGINIGKNKDVPIEDAAENYVKCFDLANPMADYIAINISSPNTPNLRELQRAENFEDLIGSLQARNRELLSKPLLVKISPDLSRAEIELIVDVCLQLEVAGIIATNTTVSRDGLITRNTAEFGSGGLSGKPLASRSNEVIRMIYRFSKGALPIIGVGGIFSGKDAFDKIAAGACLVQAYTGFIYHGPSFARDVNLELASILKARGFKNLDEAVGIEAEKTRS